MHLILRFPVAAELASIQSNFGEELFLSLTKTIKFPKPTMKEFGSKDGEQVVMELDFSLFKQQWVSKISQTKQTKNTWQFSDTGTKLPFFLKN